jgi:tRNA 2-selenouridine synthase SelU
LHCRLCLLGNGSAQGTVVVLMYRIVTAEGGWNFGVILTFGCVTSGRERTIEQLPNALNGLNGIAST